MIAEGTTPSVKTDGDEKEGAVEMVRKEAEENAPGKNAAETDEQPSEPTNTPHNLAPPPNLTEAQPPPVIRAPCNEYALRVAYAMRNLQMRQGGASSVATSYGGCAGGGEDRCPAFMEVVRKEEGRWSVSRAVLMHAHPLVPPPDVSGAGGLMPVVGMEFDSVSTAKAYFTAYSEKMGFALKTGPGKRSKGTRILLMQRFICSAGSLPSTASVGSTMKRKRGPYRKRDQKEGEGGKQDDEVIEVIPVGGGKSEGVNGDFGGEKRATFMEKGGLTLPVSQGNAGKFSTEIGNGKKAENVPLVSNPGQSRLLRELGIRVSRYTHEERRDIILKYVQKKSSRQVINRAIKIPSRQALAERRLRGVGGKFLSKDEMQTSNKQEEKIEEEPELPAEEVANAGGVPLVGMIFENEDKAYEYYTNYAGNVGFSVRKGWWDKTAKNSTRSRVYVCSREGFRPKNETKKPQLKTRTGCPARMALKITLSGKYRVTELVSDHNHLLAAPLDIQMLKSQLLTKPQPGAHQNASLIPPAYKNYIRAKRSKDMQAGDLRALLEYFRNRKGDNPSFFYAIQVDEYDQMTNVFWADARSIMDFHYFGDVVCFDTSYQVNDYGRPFAFFVGVNNHKQTVILGSTFLYDETVESFKWLFETFKSAMCGKQPKTILTDRCAAIKEAIDAAWPGTIHRFCTWQIYQNADKQLSNVIDASESSMHGFRQCFFDFEEEEEFLAAWTSMLEKYNLKDNELFIKLNEERESWALVYGRQTFSADITSTLCAENMGVVLKDNLNQDKDMPHFLKLYDLLVDERRQAELQADYQANQYTPSIPPLRLLWQAASAYTPAAFEMFRKEFELFMDCMAYSRGEFGTLSEHAISAKNKRKEQVVCFDSSDNTAVCSCRKFEFVGVQCCHVLKALDLRNIKELPPQYILTRWRKDAKCGSRREVNGFPFVGDPMSSLPEHYNTLCSMFYKIAERAAENEETFTLMVSQADQLLEQVEQILQRGILEKTSLGSATKDQSNILIRSESALHNNNNEAEKIIGRRKNDIGLRRKHHNDIDTNKRQKSRKVIGQSDEVEVASGKQLHVTPGSIPSQSRNAPNEFLSPSHFMQSPYVITHHFGLGTSQNLHNPNQFSQNSSVSALQQQQFPGNGHLTQSFPTPDMHPLQFVGTNPPLDPQSGDQGHCSMPVWDFL